MKWIFRRKYIFSIEEGQRSQEWQLNDDNGSWMQVQPMLTDQGFMLLYMTGFLPLNAVWVERHEIGEFIQLPNCLPCEQLGMWQLLRNYNWKPRHLGASLKFQCWVRWRGYRSLSFTKNQPRLIGKNQGCDNPCFNNKVNSAWKNYTWGRAPAPTRWMHVNSLLHTCIFTKNSLVSTCSEGTESERGWKFLIAVHPLCVRN